MTPADRNPERALRTKREHTMSQGDLGGLLAKAQEMQGRMAQLQQELARREVEGQSGGGMVTVIATGDLRIQRVTIDPSLVEGGDREMLQDLVAAAVNAALTEAQQMVQSEMQKMAGIGGLGAMLGGTS